MEKGTDSKGGSSSGPHFQTNREIDDFGQIRWAVVVLRAAKTEGQKILTDAQYNHVVSVLQRLVDFPDREELADLDIKHIDGDVYELREKGGVLQRINLRVYFAALKKRREIVVLKTYKKEQDRQVPRYVLVGVEDRLDDYLALGVQRGDNSFREASVGNHDSRA